MISPGPSKGKEDRAHWNSSWIGIFNSLQASIMQREEASPFKEVTEKGELERRASNERSENYCKRHQTQCDPNNYVCLPAYGGWVFAVCIFWALRRDTVLRNNLREPCSFDPSPSSQDMEGGQREHLKLPSWRHVSNPWLCTVFWRYRNSAGIHRFFTSHLKQNHIGRLSILWEV